MRGAIAAGSDEAAAAGAEMFSRGGNAVDAAVAAAWASFVVEIGLVNIGGGGFATVWDPGKGNQPIHTYDFFCQMPSKRIHPAIDFRAIEIDFGPAQQTFHIGRASVAIPGVVRGLCRLVREHGNLSLADTLEPAIRLSVGFRISKQISEIITLLAPIFRDTPEVYRTFAPNGSWLAEGDLVTLPGFCETLKYLAKNGVEAFYSGHLAHAICEDQASGGGLILEKDLAQYCVLDAKPLSVAYGGGEVFLPGSSSLGGKLVRFTLSLMQRGFLNGKPFGGHKHLSAWAHALRLTSMARNEWCQPGRALPNGDMDMPEEFFRKYWHLMDQALAGEPFVTQFQEIKGPSNTSHISAMDSEGRAISFTSSAGESAGFLVGETGMLMNNILGEDDLSPNGFHNHAPGERLVSMMAPVIYAENGVPKIALGAAGSNRLRSAIVECLSYMVDFGMSPQDAVQAPRLHFENGILHVEHGFPEDSVCALEKEGFTLKRWPGRNIYFGGVQAVQAGPESFFAGGDPRRGGSVRIF